MTEEPAGLIAQRRSIPPHVEAAVLTALEKLPADRFATAAEFAAALVSEQPTRMRTAVRPAARVRRHRRWSPTAAIAAVALLAGGLLGRGLGARSDGAPAMIRATLHLGGSAVIRPVGNIRLAVAPTGRRVAFIGSDGPDPALWVRELDQPGARRLPDTRGAFAPFFSPDGESIGFFTAADGPSP